MRTGWKSTVDIIIRDLMSHPHRISCNHVGCEYIVMIIGKYYGVVFGSSKKT